ncbi:MAG: DUF3365 domain-containing protein [Cyclobacteriaceae bacterium]
MEKMKSGSFLFVVMLLILSACQSRQETADSASSEEEAGTEQTDDLTAKAMARGQMISNASQQALASNLKNAIQTEGIPAAFRFCNVQAMPLTDSLSSTYDAQIKRATLWVRNPKDEADEVEREILEAYHQQMQQGQTPEARVVDLDENYLLYAQPILINNGLCLTCHGEVGAQVQQETYQLIKERYPEDQATGHQMGDLRGIWSIRLSKEALRKEEIIGMINR